MRRAVLLAAMALLAIPASAGARPFGPEEEQAYAFAATYWGGAVPTLCTSVEKVVLPHSEMAGNSGRATLPTSPIPCRIEVVEEVAGSGLCKVVVHEYGHLLGLGHDAIPGDADLYAACSGFDAPFKRKQAWQYWRQLKAWCATTEGRQRDRCRREVRRMRIRLQTSAGR